MKDEISVTEIKRANAVKIQVRGFEPRAAAVENAMKLAMSGGDVNHYTIPDGGDQ